MKKRDDDLWYLLADSLRNLGEQAQKYLKQVEDLSKLMADLIEIMGQFDKEIAMVYLTKLDDIVCVGISREFEEE